MPFPGFGSAELFIVLLIFTALALFRPFLRNTRVIVVSSKTFNAQGPLLFRIQGRRAGVLSWLLKLCRIETSFSFSVFKDRIEWDEDSFFWQRTCCVSMKNVSALEVSYASSLILLLISLGLLISGIINLINKELIASFVCQLLSIVIFAFFVLSKKFGVHVYSPAFSCWLLVQRSLIEGEALTSHDMDVIRQIFRFLMDPENSSVNLDEILASAKASQAPKVPESLSVSTKGAAERNFSSVVPPSPAPSVPSAPQVPPAPPRSNIPPQNPSRFHQN